jgi:hypothetical protein
VLQYDETLVLNKRIETATTQQRAKADKIPYRAEQNIAMCISNQIWGPDWWLNLLTTTGRNYK